VLSFLQITNRRKKFAGFVTTARATKKISNENTEAILIIEKGEKELKKFKQL
jgi:hypothetical protein